MSLLYFNFIYLYLFICGRHFVHRQYHSAHICVRMYMKIEDCVVVQSYVRVNMVCFSYMINIFAASTPLTAVSVINVCGPSHKVSCFARCATKL
jgi:hypothetical protein